MTCLLCNATISVRIGNYGKLKLHMETNHDVFYEQDLLMALNFLEDHEREVNARPGWPRPRPSCTAALCSRPLSAYIGAAQRVASTMAAVQPQASRCLN